MLAHSIDTREEMGKESVSKILSHYRWQNEVGVKSGNSGERKDPVGIDHSPRKQRDGPRGKKKRGAKSLRGRHSAKKTV